MRDDIFDPLNPAHSADPDQRNAIARRECPVSQPREGLHVLSRDEDVRMVYDRVERFSNRSNFTVGKEDLQFPYLLITLSDPPEHTRLRKRLLKDFAPARLRKLAARVEAIVATALDSLPASGSVDLYTDYVKYIPAAALFALIGLPESDWKRVQAMSDIVVARIPEPIEQLPEFGGLMQYLSGLVAARRANPGDRHADVLDNLCFAEEGDAEMTDPEVVTHMFQLVTAGTDTTRCLIANCLWRLLEHRDQWDRIVADRKGLPNAIEESLRFDAPGQFMVRTALEDMEISGCPVHAGDKIYLNLQSANHDERTWGETSRTFDTTREGAAGHMAFGRGIHACIGAPLARLEVMNAVSRFMDRFPQARLAPGAVWTKCEGPLLRRPETIPVDLGGAA